MKPWIPPANDRKKCVHGTNGQRAEWFPRFLEEARPARGDSPQSRETAATTRLTELGIRSANSFRAPRAKFGYPSALALPCIECQTGPYGAGTEHRPRAVAYRREPVLYFSAGNETHEISSPA